MSEFFKEQDLIEAGKIQPVYLFTGNDFFMKETLISAIYKTKKNVTRNVFYGGDNKETDFLDSLITYGLFSSEKVIVFHNINKLSRKYHKNILRYLDSPDIENIVLIFTADNIKTQLVKKIEAKVKSIKLWKPFPKYYASFIKQHVNRIGYEIENNALDLLVTITNDTLSHTFAELEKVRINIGDRKKITINDIKFIVGGEKKFTMLNFIDAIGNKKFYQAIDICMSLIHTGVKSPFFIISLHSFFYDVFGSLAGDLNDLFRVQWKKNQISTGYRNYKAANFGLIFRKLREVDLKSKSTSISTENLLIPLIYELINA